MDELNPSEISQVIRQKIDDYYWYEIIIDITKHATIMNLGVVRFIPIANIMKLLSQIIIPIHFTLFLNTIKKEQIVHAY